MSKALSHLLSLMPYPLALPPEGKIVKVRGAGKWTWSARKALKTLNNHHRVWIQADNEALGKEFRQAILRWVESLGAQEEKGYELTCCNIEALQPIFGNHCFAQVVGLGLDFSSTTASALLSPFISTEGFAFSPQEYIDLRERIQAAIRRYERLPSVSLGLEDLNTGFFRHRSLAECQEFIEHHLEKHLAAGAVLQRDFLVAINQHERASIFSKRAKLRAKANTLSLMAAKAAPLTTGKSRATKKAFKALLDEWEHFYRQVGTSDPSLPSGPAELSQQIDREQTLLEEEERKLFRNLKSEGLGLNALTATPSLCDPERLKELEERSEEWLRQVDEAGLYQLPVGGIDAATTHRQLQQVTGVLEKLKNTRAHLNELPPFYKRRQFWYAQPAHLRRLLAPLLPLPAQDWDAAFSAWYFDRCLEKHLPLAPTLARRQAPQALPDGAKSVATVPLQQRLILLPQGAPWPQQATASDLLLVLTPITELPTSLQCPIIQFAPLQDTAATPIALAGLRSASLAMVQDFSPLTPPNWRALATLSAPPGQPSDRLLARTDNDWQPITTNSFGRPTESLHLFIPTDLRPEDQGLLLQHWETIIRTDGALWLHHTFSPDALTKALLADGFTGSFLAAALIRAAEAAEAQPFAPAPFLAMGNEIRYRCGLKPLIPDPLSVQVSQRLSSLLPDYFFEAHQPWRDTFLPVVALSPAGKKTVLLPAGRLPGCADLPTEARRQQELTTAGFACLSLDVLAIWTDPDAALRAVAQQLT